MKRETRRAKLAELWDDDEEVVTALKEEIPKGVLEKNEYDEAVNLAEATLVYIGSYEDFYQSECLGCNKPFAHSYIRVTTCSTTCLRKVLESFGFDWHPERHPADRWRPKRWIPDSVTRRKGESLKDFEDRQKAYQVRLQTQNPIPLVVSADVVEMLDNSGVVLLENVPHKPEREFSPDNRLTVPESL